MPPDDTGTHAVVPATITAPLSATGNESERTSPQQSRLLPPNLKFASSSFEGPLPPPQILAEYQAIPGAAELVLEMARNSHGMARTEQAHRHSVELAELAMEGEELAQAAKNHNDKMALMKRGQLFGLIVCVAAFATALAISWVSTSQFAPFGSALLGVFGLGGIVYVFMRGNHPKQHQVAASSTRAIED